MRIWTIVLLGATGAVHGADSGSQSEAFAWLKKMANASRQQNYSGTIVYQFGNQVETSRVVHFVNSAGGEFEIKTVPTKNQINKKRCFTQKKK